MTFIFLTLMLWSDPVVSSTCNDVILLMHAVPISLTHYIQTFGMTVTTPNFRLEVDYTSPSPLRFPKLYHS